MLCHGCVTLQQLCVTLKPQEEHSRIPAWKMAAAVALIVTAVLLFLIIRILNLTDASRVPKIISSKNPFTSRVLRSCPMLFEK